MVAVHSDRCIGLLHFVFVDTVCGIEEGIVGSDVGCLDGCIGSSIGYFDCLGGSMEDLVVV